MAENWVRDREKDSLKEERFWSPVDGGYDDEVIAWECANLVTYLGHEHRLFELMNHKLKRAYYPGPDMYLEKAFHVTFKVR